MSKESRNIVRLIARGQTNKFGNLVYDYGNKLLIAGLGAKASFYMSLYQSGETIVGIIFDLIGGVFADTRDRKRILVVTDLLAALVTFIVWMLFSPRNAALLVVVNIVLAILYAFNSPTYKAIVKDLLSKANVYRYNSFSKTISEFISVVSPLFGMFLISAAIDWRFEPIVTPKPRPALKRSTFGAMRQGFDYIWHDRELMVVLVASSLINFFFAGYEFALPFTNQMGHFAHLYAYILIAESVGNITGATLNGLWGKDLSLRQYSHFLLGVALPIVILPFVSFHWLVPVVLCGLSSGFMTVFNVQMFSSLQTTVAADYLGRVFSVIFTVAILFMPVGTFFFATFSHTSWLIFTWVGAGELAVYLVMATVIRSGHRAQ
ncbi:MFS transporter [Lacticaseibacillus kribbianus]|uniref:MFS transporter n=1 Tax=Lacticaseibacillus kribbianus TaxID=2926292 RepID=UPI001CD7C94F|nr:MFS transporter [Lacticaseibacillus kribbianus]